MGRYTTYKYCGRALPDGFGRNPAIDINGDVTEIPTSLLASPDAVLMTEWGWYTSAVGLYNATSHPAFVGDGAFQGRDGVNSGRVDGSVVWVDESEAICRYYIQDAYWHKW